MSNQLLDKQRPPFLYPPAGPIDRLYPKPEFDRNYFRPSPGNIHIHVSCSEGRAGYGVFFGPGNPLNVSQRLCGADQTRYRAQLMALITALEVTHSPIKVRVGKTHQETQMWMQRAEYVRNVYMHPHIYTDFKFLAEIESKHLGKWILSPKPKKNGDLLLRLSECVQQGRRINWHFVKTGDKGHEAAFKLAQAGRMEEDLPFLTLKD